MIWHIGLWLRRVWLGMKYLVHLAIVCAVILGPAVFLLATGPHRILWKGAIVALYYFLGTCGAIGTLEEEKEHAKNSDYPTS